MNELLTADLPPDIAREIDEACNRFERAWRGGGDAPRIEEFLAGCEGTGGIALVRELITLDIFYRRRIAHG